MRRPMWTQGRRGAVLGASAAVVMCAGGLGLLAVESDGQDGGYVATGAAPGPSGAAAPPTAGVRLIPLDGEESGPSPSGEAAPTPSASGTPPIPPPAPAPDARPSSSRAPTGPGSPPASAGPSKSPSTAPVSPAPPPAGPAVLDVGEPERAAADRRWCERVTLTFHNSGGTTVRSGSVTLGTHIIGALGIDWATIESTQDIPTPIAPGARVSGSWTVCVDAWRVPLGMHVETRDVSVRVTPPH